MLQLDNDLIEFALQLEEQRKEALLAACFRPRELNYDQECEAIFLKIKTYLEQEYEKEVFNMILYTSLTIKIYFSVLATT